MNELGQAPRRRRAVKEEYYDDSPHSSLDDEDEALELQGSSAKRQKTCCKGSSGLTDQFCEDSTTVSMTTMAMSNELVLKTILKNLPISDLLSCRLVNKQWKEAAKIVLKSRPEPAFINVSNETDFDELSHCILDCGVEDFPFRGIKANICYSDFGYKPQRWSRLLPFRIFGDIFTHRRAKIDLYSSSNRELILSTVFSGPLASIEELEIQQLQYLNIGEGSLEALKVIRFRQGYSLEYIAEEELNSLLTICPNLQEIQGIHYRTMLGVAAVKKKDLVSHMFYCSCEKYSERGRDRTATVPEKLSMFTIKCNHSRSADTDVQFGTVKEILEASSESLNSLEIRSQVSGASSSTDWPELPNLKHLIIAAKNNFPPQVSQIFPALQTVALEAASTDLNLQSYLWTDTVPTVNVLELRCLLSPEGVDLLASIFPNVSTITVHCCRIKDLKAPGRFCRNMWDIWGLKKFEKLTKLKIIDMPMAVMSTEELSLDSFVTGFPQFVLANMRAKPELLKTSYVEEMREGKCITELQGLKELYISFDLDGLEETDFEEEPFVSEFMLEAGLDLMPNLDATTFYYDFADEDAAGVMEKLLLPVAGVIACRYFEGLRGHSA